jgi:membrane protease YdiL (CAAX protease family)
VNGFGEEIGWRGFLLPSLRARYGVRGAALVVAALWAFWHLPFFFLLASYRGFAPLGLVGFAIGIASGSVVAAWLYYGAGESVLAVAVWHAAYNMAVATAASSGMVAALVSALVIVQAVVVARSLDRGQLPRPIHSSPPS